MEQKKGLRAQIPLSLHTQANEASGPAGAFSEVPAAFLFKNLRFLFAKSRPCVMIKAPILNMLFLDIISNKIPPKTIH